jgi:RNA polymerase sigma-70 factor (ECF subfamily)
MKVERDLVEGVKLGMASAFDQLYELYANRLYHFALSILKSKQDAEEVVQNTFFKIWEKRHSLESNTSFKAYIFKIAYHVTVDLLRDRLKEKKYQDNLVGKATANFNLEDSIDFADLLDRVNEIVKELPPRKSEIYQLSRVDHLSYGEIAEKLNISVKTVENAINFSIHFIKKRLGDDSLVILLYAALFL